MNIEQITEKFIKEGWSEDTKFTELTMEEAINKGYSFVIKDIENGKKYFKMNISGNIYNEKGVIVLYNI